MKKNILIICLLVSVPTMAFDNTKCTAAKGEILTGKDETTYCYSPFSMNWWSAFSWCEAIGGVLIDYTEECFKTVGEGGCPNLKVNNLHFWTQIPSASGKAFYINNMSSCIEETNRTNVNLALCK